MKSSKYLLFPLGLIVGSAMFAQSTTLLNDSFSSAPSSPVSIATSGSSSVMGQNAAATGGFTGPTAQWFPNGGTTTSAIVYTNAASPGTTGTLSMPVAASQSVTAYFVPFASGYRVLSVGDALTMTCNFKLSNTSPPNNATALKFGLFNSGSTTGTSNQSTKSTGNTGTVAPNVATNYSGYYCAFNPNQSGPPATVATVYSRPVGANTNFIGSTAGFNSLGTSTATASFTNNGTDTYQTVLTVYYQSLSSITVIANVYDINISTTTPMANYSLSAPSTAVLVNSFDGLTIGDNFQAAPVNPSPQTLTNVTVTYIPQATVAVPTFSPAAGTYTSGQSVSISSVVTGISSVATGLSFAYTTDGSTPTESGGSVTHGTLYTTPIAVSASTTIKAISFTSVTGGNDSAVSSAAYTINLPQASAPTFSPVAGTYTSAQAVTISSTTGGASIAYTTDGSTPTESGGSVTNGTLYSGAVAVSANTTLSAIAFKTGNADSAVATAAYVIAADVPTFSPVAGTYTSAQAVTISSTTAGASIAYTTDGSTPTESGGSVTNGTLYSGAVAVSANTTLSAIAFKTGNADSAVATAAYVIAADVPTFSPVAGTYTSAQAVTISSTTAGASIAYTTDGSTPTESGGSVTNGTLYSGAVAVSANTTLKAIAFKTGNADSAVATAAYVIAADVPTFSPVAGAYTSAQAVTISSTTAGASFAYTTDGSTPTESGGSVTHGTLYSGAVAVSANTTLKAIAFKTGNGDSAVATAAYVIAADVPTFSPVAGAYTSAQAVTISSTTAGASIAYTTDGSTPTESGGSVTNGTLYSGAVAVSANTTLKAIAFKTGYGDSAVATAAYVIAADVPTFSPVAGAYTSAQAVTISSTTAGASIAYTTDGSTPTESGGSVTNGTLYSGAVAISANTTLKAIAFKTGNDDSAVATAAYVIAADVPTFSPVAGAYTSAQAVTIISTTAGASIAYTTDGSTPTESGGSVTNGTLYSTPVAIGANTTLKAIAFKTGLTDSTVATAAYVIAADVPTFSPVAGAYTSAQAVTIISTTAGASIAYTTDGSTPTESGGSVTNGTLYSTPVAIGANTTLKAIAFKTGYGDSAVATAAYVIAADVPTFSPVAGTYTSAQSVTISSTTAGASFAYTTDGSTPTESGGSVTHGILYSGAVAISANTTLKAIAFKTGFGDSAVATAAYVIAADVPTFSPVAGTYTAAQSVTISSTTGGASIAYTTDGSTPTQSGGSVTNGTLYSTPVAIGANTTLKAIAFKTGQADSAVATAIYTINLTQTATPTFSPVAGTYTSAQAVTISSITSGASIAYTTDGSTPTESGGSVTNGTLYSGAVAINATTTLNAIAFKTGLADSTVATAAYILQVATPTFSPVAGTYTSAQAVTISSTTAGASFAYTTDGSTPTESGGSVTNGTLYSGAVAISANTTLKAIAFKTGYDDSAVATAAYVIAADVPTFSPVAGTYTSAQAVTISSTTAGASFAYTTDGSTPTESGGSVTHGTLYSGAVAISANTTLKAIAFKTGFGDSAVATAAYVIAADVPTFSPVAGTYTSAQAVTISSTTAGASIAYTTDGSTPTESGGSVTHGTLYSGAVAISANTTLKAIAFKTGQADSAVATAAYVIAADVPTFSPVAGAYTSAQAVTISSTTAGASIAYTTDGSTPTESGGSVTNGTLYSGAVAISANTTLKAIAFKTGFGDSAVATAAYVIAAGVPTFSPVAGTYTSAQAVTISSTTAGASIAYTTDGSTPTESGGSVTNGTLYSGAVAISANTTLKAIAFKTGFGDSAVATAAYVIAAGVPTFSPVAGAYTSAQAVTISSTTGGASFAYTTDGSTPTESGGSVTNGTLYSGAVAISANTTLKAIAFKTGFGDSAVATAAYVIAAGVPTFSPVAGAYTSAQAVTISSTTGGASFAYTTDGSTPTESGGSVTNGTLYSGAVAISANTTLKAIAFKTGFGDSAVATAAYVIAAGVPTFSPVAGAYTSAQAVTISSTTAGASIAYTTDGSTPTESGGSVTHGTLYSTPVAIGATTTLNAIAFKTGYGDSAVATAAYALNIAGVVSAPTFSPPGGAYTSAQSVTISSTTAGASFAYTTDGSTPTESGGSVTHGTLYSGAVAISATTTLNAIAFKTGLTDSAVATAAYALNIAGVVSAPTFSPSGGAYASAQAVTISSTTAGASFAYTTDGSTPTESGGSVTHGTLYSGAVAISANTTLNAIAFKTGLTDSAVATGGYTIAAAVPTFSPVAGTYTSVQAVTISSTTAGASIAYTTDGSTPTESGGSVTNGTLYSGAVAISANTTLKAIAFKTGFGDSAVATVAYTINLPLMAAPTFSPVAGTYTAAQLVTITSATGGASIRYTTDGSTPTATTGTVYSSPVSIGSTATLKAIAYEAGFTDSSVTSGAYTINLPVAVGTPVFSPAAGSFASAQSVSITSTTSGASIRYTMDGSAPSQANGTLYSGPAAIAATTTLKAIAYESGFLDSSVTSGTYTINLPAAAAPTFSPVAGTYTSAQSVTLASTTSGASICYTTDGSTPTESNGIVTHGTAYSGPISVGATMTISAIAFKTGSSDSNVATAAFTIVPPAPSSGGAFDDWFLGALAAAGIARWRLRKKTG